MTFSGLSPFAITTFDLALVLEVDPSDRRGLSLTNDSKPHSGLHEVQLKFALVFSAQLTCQMGRQFSFIIFDTPLRSLSRTSLEGCFGCKVGRLMAVVVCKPRFVDWFTPEQHW